MLKILQIPNRCYEFVQYQYQINVKGEGLRRLKTRGANHGCPGKTKKREQIQLQKRIQLTHQGLRNPAVRDTTNQPLNQKTL